jgi:elongation factor G
MGRENANFMKTVEQIKAKYGNAIAPFQVPIMEQEHFIGFVDAVHMVARKFKGIDEIEEVEIPEALNADVEPIRTMLIEAAAETSEELMEKYFAGETLSDHEIQHAVHSGVVSGDIVPVLCGSGLKNAGVQILMDEMIEMMPAPNEGQVQTGEDMATGEVLEAKVGDLDVFSAIVFKTVIDPFVGKLSLFKVISGKLNSGDTVYNTNHSEEEKANSLYYMLGKKQINASTLVTGDIGALAKLQRTKTGDTLCAVGQKIKWEGVNFPTPMISLAVSAENEKNEEKVIAGLYRLMEEDPTFVVSQNKETGETLVSGVGEMQLDVIASKLKAKFNVKAVYREPKIAYRETIRKPIKVDGKHKKQSGGHGQFGHVWIEFEPMAYDEAPFEFVDKVVGGAVPRQYIPAVEKGLMESLNKGVLAGYPMLGLRATLYDGSFHPVDSSEMAFKVAAAQAYKKLDTASPVMLEPIVKMGVLVPDDYMGDIIGDLNRRRGRVLGMTPIGKGMQRIDAEVPQGEVTKYATDLRSMAHGYGKFTSEFIRYEEMPSNISSKIIDEAKKLNEIE